jgi:hypothetical protein
MHHPKNAIYRSAGPEETKRNNSLIDDLSDDEPSELVSKADTIIGGMDIDTEENESLFYFL